MSKPLIIGTRGSDLALWQANFVKGLLEGLGHRCELKIIKTQGDVMSELSPDKMEGKGFFTKEIEDALLNNETDIAVHSFKDLPTESPAGLLIAAVSEREDPSELLLINKDCVDDRKKFSLKINATVGTSSARRKSQMLAFRPDLKLIDIRGNVPTRIKKLKEKQFDAILIASAGVERLNIDVSEFHSEKINPEEIVPAPAQGVLAIQIREKDKELASILSKINNEESGRITNIERKVLNLFQGGCQTPVGVYATYDEDREMYCVRVAKSKSAGEFPHSIYSESSNPGSMPEKIIEKINAVTPCEVFITRKHRKESYLRNVLEGNGFALTENALIEITAVPFNSLPSCEWIFFSSKHAVKFFFEQKPTLSSERFACVGKSTADELRNYGKRAEFIGSSTDTRMTGKKFASMAGNAKVLFPQAKGSMQSIQRQFPRRENVIDLVVYETLKGNNIEMPTAKIIVFTSPSNVEAWFEKYNFPKDKIAVAMGDATSHVLKLNNVIAVSHPDTFDDPGLARAIFGASTGRNQDNQQIKKSL